VYLVQGNHVSDIIESSRDIFNVFQEFIDIFVDRRDLVIIETDINFGIAENSKGKAISNSKLISGRKNIRV
jgi:predicted RNase H-like nuclease